MEQSVLTDKTVPNDLETTYALLQATIPSIKSPDTNENKIPFLNTPSTLPSEQAPSPYVCSSEDEIFFGSPTEKELNGKSAREVQNWTKTKNGRRKTLKMDTSTWRRRKSAYNVENSIEEENENEENSPPPVISNDQSLRGNNEEKDNLDTVIDKFANLKSPMIDSQKIKKGSCDQIQSNTEPAPKSSPIPSPRKIKNILTRNNDINKPNENLAVFGERLLENELKSFEQLASENKTDNIKSSDNRKYRSRSPLLKKDDSFFDEDKNIEQEKITERARNINSNSTEDLSNPPTPKLRTKYYVPKSPKSTEGSNSTKSNIPRLSENEVSSKNNSSNESTSTLKWKRRSVKQPNCESEDEEEDQNTSVLKEENVSQNQVSDVIIDVPNNSQNLKEENEKSIKNDPETESKLQNLLVPDDASDAESSIIDVDNDQMFDDTVFTEYDDLNISKMTQKMSNHWRNKFECEDRGSFKKKKEKMSLEELVNNQSDENRRNGDDTNKVKDECSLNITDNRTRRRKPLQETKSDFQLSSSDLVGRSTTVVNETVSSVSSSVSCESEIKTNVEVGKDDSGTLIESKIPLLPENNKEQELHMPEEQYSPKEDQDDSNLSTCSDWFNTTREEMILYEKFGEDYDEIVEKMTKEEKIKLKEEVNKASPKNVEELLGENSNISKECPGNNISENITSALSMNTDSEKILKRASNSCSEVSNSFTSKMKNVDGYNHADNTSDIIGTNLNCIENYVVENIIESVTSSGNRHNENKNIKGGIKSISTSLESLGEEIKNKAEENKYLQDSERSTNSSKNNSIDIGKSLDERSLAGNENSLSARIQKAQEEMRKNTQNQENYKSIIDIVETPPQNQQREKKIFETPSIIKDFKFKTPTSGKTGLSTIRTANYSSGDHFRTKIINGSGQSSIPSYQRDTKASTLKRSPAKNKMKSTPSSGNIFPSPLDFGSKRGLPSSVVDMDKIVSPISQYINANPVPPTMKHIRPKTSKFLDFEIQEVANDHNTPSPKVTTAPKKIFAPLPAAKYCSSKVAVQIPVAPDNELKELPKAFGVTNTVQAKVVKHVGRTKVPRALAQQDILKATENMKTLSPNAIQIGLPTIHQRDSTFYSRESNIGGTSIDQSTMEMSLQETKEIKKPTSTTLERKAQ